MTNKDRARIAKAIEAANLKSGNKFGFFKTLDVLRIVKRELQKIRAI